jgi:pimeloyl-ACP methyl ester carboxylesterase
MTDSMSRCRQRKTFPMLLGNGTFRRWLPGRRLARLAVFTCCLYIASLLGLLALEDRLLFTGATVDKPWRAPPEGMSVRELSLTDADGNHIHAWFSAPLGWSPGDGAILFSHGQGGNLSTIAARAFRWRASLNRAVMLYDYPGYGRSRGRPSEAGCIASGEATLRWLVEEQRTPLGEVFLVGESMGGAMATELATRHEVRLLVLHGAFTSFPDMAQRRFPIFPGRYLVHNRMDNESKIGRVRCPVLLTHGTADWVVPFAQGERLYAAARWPKRFFRVEGGGHAPPSGEEFFEEVRAFLAQTAR